MQAKTTPGYTDELMARLAALAHGAPAVLLLLSEQESTLIIAAKNLSNGGNLGADQSAEIHHLGVGLSTPVHGVLCHDSPRPAELEYAIELIEDAIMPLAARINPGSVLFVAGSALTPLWKEHSLATARTAPLSIGIIETAFLNLAAVAAGRPAASSGVPPGRAYAMQLLMLREAMHHWGFAQVSASKEQVLHLTSGV
ncbi:MAG: hypothetical protein NTY70_07905 [Burkholderiales bacterium]|nr:hypothetical protein [Burkholderiales bacterium]